MKERTSIYCHNCSRYLTVELDIALDGDHVCECPCGHKHYRTVKAGKITGARWANQDGTPDAAKLAQAQIFKGQPGSAPPLPPAPAPAPATFMMTIVFSSFSSNAGGSTQPAYDHDTTSATVMLSDAWSSTIAWVTTGGGTSS